MRQEVALAKAELADSGKKAGKGGGMLAGAGVAGHFVLIFLSVALWWGLGDLMDNNTISAIIVALLWGVVAAVLAAKGKAELKKVQGAPQTQETVAEIPNALKGHEEENR
ncbi:phage holin family protein [Actinotalea ferrariae]|nr:phage holin family protein [Actinotalea ferrariae]